MSAARVLVFMAWWEEGKSPIVQLHLNHSLLFFKSNSSLSPSTGTLDFGRGMVVEWVSGPLGVEEKNGSLAIFYTGF